MFFSLSVFLVKCFSRQVFFLVKCFFCQVFFSLSVFLVKCFSRQVFFSLSVFLVKCFREFNTALQQPRASSDPADAFFQTQRTWRAPRPCSASRTGSTRPCRTTRAASGRPNLTARDACSWRSRCCGRRRSEPCTASAGCTGTDACPCTNSSWRCWTPRSRAGLSCLTP